jgi:1-acyl-sn-glycerol-3-phosphate acyltransferase
MLTTTADLAILTDASGRYQTSPARPGLLARWFPSLVFYYHFLQSVFWASGLARQGKYGGAEWYASSFAVLRALERVGASIELTGLDVLTRIAGPCVFVSNHMSTLETIILPGIVQPFKDVTFVVKRGIVEYPVFKHLMLARDPIVVDRVNPREDLVRVLQEGVAMLKRGRSVIIFPQTTRTICFDPGHFNTIGVKLARDADVPIVPIAVRTDAWGNGRVIKDFGRIDPTLPVKLAFGPAVAVTGRGNEAHRAIVRYIVDKLTGWGAEVVSSPAAPV